MVDSINLFTAIGTTKVAAYTAWKVFKYWVFSSPYFPVFNSSTRKYGPERTLYLDTFHAVRTFCAGADLPAKLLSIEKTNKRCFVELNLKRIKWSTLQSANPTKWSNTLESLSWNLDSCPFKHGNYLIGGDFNVSIQKANMKNFCERFSLKSS